LILQQSQSSDNGDGALIRSRTFILEHKFVIVLTLVLIFVIGMSLMSYFFRPAGVNGKVEVTIPPNSTTSEIAALLKQRGLIRNESFFIFYTRFLGLDQSLKAGEYEFDGSVSLSEIIARLHEGSSKMYTFTIPEGYTVAQIAGLLDSKGFVKKEDFLHAVESAEFEFPYLEKLPRGDHRLEGFLFPDTYKISPYMNAEEIIQMMLDRFVEIYKPRYQKRAEELGMTTLEAVTLASIVEREAKKPEERPIIAAVFHNRLKKGMRLQSCATVQYALGEVKPVLTYKDLEIQSPYNTYLHQGLPRGPICSPGEASIKAALYPADVPYLYFVAKDDGSHTFSNTLEEHRTAAKKQKLP